VPKIPSVIACVDDSRYAAAVCDYAAWLAGPMEASVTLLHACGRRSREAGARVLREAAQRLADHGVECSESLLRDGAFAEAAIELSAEGHLLVLGKRGADGFDNRQALGANIDPVVRATAHPLLLVSSLFLPVSRTLALIDADPKHRRTVEFVRAQAWLSNLELDLMMLTDGKGGGEAKLGWARETLRAHAADVFPMPVEGPHEALARFRRDQPVDLLILSREMALQGGQDRLQEIEADSLWAWRAPVLIC